MTCFLNFLWIRLLPMVKGSDDINTYIHLHPLLHKSRRLPRTWRADKNEDVMQSGDNKEAMQPRWIHQMRGVCHTFCERWKEASCDGSIIFPYCTVCKNSRADLNEPHYTLFSTLYSDAPHEDSTTLVGWQSNLIVAAIGIRIMINHLLPIHNHPVSAALHMNDGAVRDDELIG